jgi:uncharacterized protein (DUF1697 family)
MQNSKERFVAFLRGINVGGHHKVPMAELRATLSDIGLENIVTILNSGNIIFDSDVRDTHTIEKIIADTLEKKFGFPVPTIIRKAELISQLVENGPFKEIEPTKDMRLYISLLKNDPQVELALPWTNADKSYKIIELRDKIIFSVLDLSMTTTIKKMENIEKLYGKDITTRNWKTIERIVKKL